MNARFVIMAVPPNLYSRVSFNPPLPRRQHQMHQHQSLGLVIKVHAVYSSPFWREDGLSGTCFGAGALVQEVYDNTNHEDPRGTLVGFVSDEKADAVFELSADGPPPRHPRVDRRLPRREGPEPEVYYESDWGSEEWTRGAYAASYDLGGLHRYGKDQHAPVGPIYWSSSDLAAEGYQHVDGAVRMGQPRRPASRKLPSRAQQPASLNWRTQRPPSANRPAAHPRTRRRGPSVSEVGVNLPAVFLVGFSALPLTGK